MNVVNSGSDLGSLLWFSVHLQADVTDKGTLSLINAYNPGLSSAWMLQRAMSVRVGEDVDRDLINRMLASNFSSMAASGEDVMKPFLQVWPARPHLPRHLLWQQNSISFLAQ